MNTLGKFIKNCLFLSTLLLQSKIGLSLPVATAATPPTPNIVFILTDDQDRDSLNYMPRLNELLINKGMVFNQHILNVSLCCPSRTTLLTGMYASNHHVYANDGETGGILGFNNAGLNDKTIGIWLQTAGYRTALMGKLVNGYYEALPAARRNEFLPGYDVWLGAAGNIHNEYNISVNENGVRRTYSSEDRHYGGDLLTGRAETFIKESAQMQKPFFLYLANSAPHNPAIPARRHLGPVVNSVQKYRFRNVRSLRTPAFFEADRRDKPTFFGSVKPETIPQIDELARKRIATLQATDEGIGRLYKAVKDSGQLANTYFFFMSDNGYHLGQHNKSNTKNTAYDESIRVPFIIMGPGVEAGKTLDYLTTNADFTATVVALSGATLPLHIQLDGRSLVPLFSAATRPGGANWRKLVPTAHYVGGGEGGGFPEFFGVRTQRWSFVEYTNLKNEKELYNLAVDPYELQNYIGPQQKQEPPPGLLAKLIDRNLRMKSCQGDTCRAIEDEPIE